MTSRIRKPYSWPVESVELLRKLWLEGHDATHIARAIGHGLTRNAVIGKADRLGLPGHATARITYRANSKKIQVQYRRYQTDAQPYRPGDPSPYSRRFIEKREANG